jgi:saccharopine dehydrogenase-like NADP-dependent oxidoreductase
VDINTQALEHLHSDYNVIPIPADFNDLDKIKEIVKGYDLVVGAVPGFLGYNVVKSVIEAGKNVVDISFFPEDPFDLDLLAQEKGVTAIVDFGVAPGMCHFLLGYHNHEMVVQSFTCYVGGLPVERKLPFQYKAPFSPVDVIEEYTRPARLVENGKLVVLDAMTDSELIDFEGVGTLEAFNSDGLRTLIKTMSIPVMKEKTLRYPGHIELIQNLNKAGFFDKNEIEIGNNRISPIEFTSKILINNWKLTDNDDEFTIMKIIIEGLDQGKHKSITYNMLDKRDKVTGFSSMARTTGYACTAAANLVLDGKFTKKGICPPEFVAEKEECFYYVMEYQKARGINYEMEIIEKE